MSNVTSEKALDKAIELICNADELTYKWSTHLITVQSGLVTVLGGLSAWKADSPSVTMYLVSILISIIAILVTFVLTNIVIRQHEYGHAYVEMAKRVEGEKPFLYDECISVVPGIKFRKIMGVLRATLISAWAIVATISVVLALRC